MVGWLWALPLTLCGLPVWCVIKIWQPKMALAQLNKASIAPVFIAYGAPMAWLLDHHPFGAMDAVAVGCCVFARDEVALQRCLGHELVHVRQAMQWGVFFPLAYGLCSLWAWMQGRSAYADNYFEIQARREGCQP